MDKSIVKKELLKSYDNSNFSYFVFEKYESFNNELSSSIFPIRKNTLLGSTFINILNFKIELYDSFYNLIKLISNCSSLKDIPNILTSYSNEFEGKDYFYPIFYYLRKQYYNYIRHVDDSVTEQHLKELTIIFSRHLTNIKSTIENFCTFLATNRNDVKTYLLWDMNIPNSTLTFGSFDDEEQAIYIQPSMEFERFESSNSLNRLISLRKYRITNFLELLNIYIDFYLQNKSTINKCEYCGKYFIPDNRSDEKYCSYPCPDFPSKTCKDYASKKAYAEKQKSDVIKKENYNATQFFRMHIKRAKLEREQYFYERKLELYKINFDKKYKKFVNQKVSEDEFANWIVSQKVIFNTKSSKGVDN